MRHYLKTLIITGISFYIAYSFVPTINLGQDPKNILYIIGGLLLIFLLIDPIFSLVLLPVNHLTFGLLMLVLNVAFIFALISFLPGFHVGAYSFPGANVQGIILPSMSFNQLEAIILVSFIITLSQKILHIIFE